MRTLITIILYSIICSNAFAQHSRSSTYHKRDGRIAAFGLNVGYYRPILYYYNNIYLENSGVRLDGGVSFGAVLDYYVTNGIYVRAGLDFASQSLETRDVVFKERSRSDDFSLSTLHGSLVGYYELTLKRGIKPYAGLGIGILRGEVDHSINYEDFDTAYVNTGYPLYGIAVGGVNYMLTEELDIGVEFRLYWPAHHGDYSTVELGNSTTTLSYAGPTGLLRIAYRFDSIINRDRLDVRKRRLWRNRKARGR